VSAQISGEKKNQVHNGKKWYGTRMVGGDAKENRLDNGSKTSLSETANGEKRDRHHLGYGSRLGHRCIRPCHHPAGGRVISSSQMQV